MSKHIGKIKERLALTLCVKNQYYYEKSKFTGWGTESHTIYILEDTDGNVFKWDTMSVLGRDTNDGFEAVNTGDLIKVKATVKDHAEYKGVAQTVITRVTLNDILEKGETPEQRAERLEKEKQAKIQAQRDSIKDGDVIMRMPYRQYKERYSDCETLIGSYDAEHGRAKISVIVRAGRLKASGVRGEHFHGYEIAWNEKEKEYKTTYRAVCEENALKRFVKDFPNIQNYKCVKIYW